MSLQVILVTSLCLCAATLAGCSKAAPAGPAEQKQETEPRLKHGKNGEPVLNLDSGTQKLMGLQTMALEPAMLAPEAKAYGQVLSISGLASLVADLISTRAASEASQAELQRLRTLAAQSNASERAVQAAEAAAVRDQALFQSARLRLIGEWGTEIAQHKDLGQLVESLGSRASALVRLDVPVGSAVPANPVAARIFRITEEQDVIEARFVGSAPVIDPQFQGKGFLFLVETNKQQLVPGTSVGGRIQLPGEPRQGVSLPENAVLRHNGLTWVYVQTGENTFERTRITLDAPLNTGWFIGGELKPGQKVVIAGAQELLSEELHGSTEE